MATKGGRGVKANKCKFDLRCECVGAIVWIYTLLPLVYSSPYPLLCAVRRYWIYIFSLSTGRITRFARPSVRPSVRAGS